MSRMYPAKRTAFYDKDDLSSLHSLPQTADEGLALDACRSCDAESLRAILTYGLRDSMSVRLLGAAAASNSIACIKVLLEAGWEVDARSRIADMCEYQAGSRVIEPEKHRNHPSERSALRVAVRHGHLEATNFLLEEGARPSYDMFEDLMALDDVLRSKVDPIALSLFNHINQDSECVRPTIIIAAIRANAIDLSIALVKAAAVSWGVLGTVVKFSTSDALFSTVLPLSNESERLNALFDCIQAGRSDWTVQLLRSLGLPPSAKNEEHYVQALIAAADAADMEVVRVLIDDGKISPNVRGAANYTPIHQASASHGETAGVLKLLLDRGADPNLRNKGEIEYEPYYLYSYSNMLSFSSNTKKGDTPLHLVARAEASTEELEARAQALLDKGADVNARNDQSQTPLHVDAFRASYYRTRGGTGSLDDFLVNHGADEDLRDDEGKTAQDILEETPLA